jgi:hypothetical protein
MNRLYRFALVLALLTVACVTSVAAEDTTAGSDTGWYVIHCNVEWAKVYLDDKYVGLTAQGTLTVPVSTTDTPYKKIRVQKNGYAVFTDSITKVPAKSGSVDLYTTLNMLPETTETVVGGDVGWYVVHCNIEDATVLFDGSNRGVITRGVVYVPVYSTGTPYKEYTVKKDGYTTFSAPVPTVPGKGETYDLYATLNPFVTTETTAVKIGGDTGYYKVNCNVDGATVTFDNEEKGYINDGSLKVQVYVTGTPYRTFTVSKAGYTPFNGTIGVYPAKGETVNLYATLNAPLSETTSPESTSTQKSPEPFWVGGLAVIIAGAALSVISRK